MKKLILINLIPKYTKRNPPRHLSLYLFVKRKKKYCLIYNQYRLRQILTVGMLCTHPLAIGAVQPDTPGIALLEKYSRCYTEGLGVSCHKSVLTLRRFYVKKEKLNTAPQFLKEHTCVPFNTF